MDLIKSSKYNDIIMPKHRNNKNKHSGGVLCSACNAFILVCQNLAISDASLFRHIFRCPDARHVFLKRAYVTVASELLF